MVLNIPVTEERRWWLSRVSSRHDRGSASKSVGCGLLYGGTALKVALETQNAPGRSVLLPDSGRDLVGRRGTRPRTAQRKAGRERAGGSTLTLGKWRWENKGQSGSRSSGRCLTKGGCGRVDREREEVGEGLGTIKKGTTRVRPGRGEPVTL